MKRDDMTFQETLQWVEQELKQGKNDTLHDFLAYLAGQMIEMNKIKQEDTKEFLSWLKDVHGINKDNLEPKTYLDRFYELRTEDFFKHLEKNKIKPKPKDYLDIKQALEDSASKINFVVKKITVTDDLIDQIVYKLYGLTEEEIEIVEGPK